MKNELINRHKNQGTFIQVDETNAFIYEKGTGEAVVCFHGVPASSFLYRKIIDILSENELRGISFDLLGMGLSDRPSKYDYSWTGLGKWSTAVIKKLKLEKFHIVIHDIGGPIACEVMSRIPEQILSVTMLNTMLVNLPAFKKPFPMWFFPKKIIGELFVSSTNPFLFQKLMQFRGVHKNETFSIKEATAYLKFLKGNDNGKAFLKIMRRKTLYKHPESSKCTKTNHLGDQRQRTYFRKIWVAPAEVS